MNMQGYDQTHTKENLPGIHFSLERFTYLGLQIKLVHLIISKVHTISTI